MRWCPPWDGYASYFAYTERQYLTSVLDTDPIPPSSISERSATSVSNRAHNLTCLTSNSFTYDL